MVEPLNLILERIEEIRKNPNLWGEWDDRKF
jgi:hypothetical protein